MSGSKHFDSIAVITTALMLVLTVLFINGAALGIQTETHIIGYENRLFDNTRVHTVDIVMDDWDNMIDNAESEEYYTANVAIDGESYKNVGIRTKGNTSLSTVKTLGSERYSFKIEFDHYDSSKSYYGLDKLSLNNLIQDSTMMKDYLTYTMMNEFGVNSSLCSYVYITVNGADWGLYLAVEGVEEAFLERNYGYDYGELYKPDSQSMGGGRGNGGYNANGGFGVGGEGGMEASDVKLQYIDDELGSYSNIWDNAKTDITEADKNRLIASLKKLSNYEDIDSVVDVEQVIRYFVVHNYVCNGDSYTGSMVHNYYLYEKDGKLAMIPWDYNLAFGTFGGESATEVINTPIDTPVYGGSSDRPMLNWIYESEEYTQLYHKYFSEFLSNVDIDSIIYDAYALIKDYVAKDPTAFYSYDEFELGIETLGQFCTLRRQSIEMQLENDETTDDMSYVNASAITLSDMGSMGGGTGGENMPSMPDKSVPSDSSTQPPSFTGQNADNGMPGGSDAPNAPNDFDPSNMPSGSDGRFPSQSPGEESGDIPTGGIGVDEGDGQNRPFGGNMQMPDGEIPFDMNGIATDSNMSAWILLAVSVVVLAVGLIVAKRYKA